MSTFFKFRSVLFSAAVAFAGLTAVRSDAHASVGSFFDGPTTLVILIHGDGADNEIEVNVANDEDDGVVDEWLVWGDIDGESFVFDSEDHPPVENVLILMRTWGGSDEIKARGLFADVPEFFQYYAELGSGNDTFETGQFLGVRMRVPCWVNGTSGINYIEGGDGPDRLFGGADFDVIYGHDGDDLIVGGADGIEDELHGNEGADTLGKDVEAPVLYGNAYVYVLEQTEDYVDFDPAEGDTIQTVRRAIPRSGGSSRRRP